MKFFDALKRSTSLRSDDHQGLAGDAGPKVRCFAALECPPDWKEELTHLQAGLKQKLQGKCFRWVQPDQMHLTLRFFGSITPESAEELKKAIHEIPVYFRPSEPLILDANKLGCFPRPNSPRVLWLGLQASAGLAELHKRVTDSTAEFGEPPESRPFKPHLTLARIKEPSCVAVEHLQMALNSLNTWSAGSWEVKELILFQSQLSPQGAKYQKLVEAQL
ncbi:MAG: RNA 2',3'-cyclic phosphodiesterase [Verrucomicrobiales bacterium]